MLPENENDGQEDLQLSVYRRAALSRRAPCGTESAYLRHRRNDEPTDEACRHAHAEAEKRRRAARKARQAAADSAAGWAVSA